MKYFDRKGLIKTIYSLMMTDGYISDAELKQFEEIGSEVDSAGFASIKDDIISEFDEKLAGFVNDQDYYDMLQENIDSLIKDSFTDESLTPRYVIWNLFAVAYNEERIDQEELRLIRHVSRTLEMNKADYLELEQYMKTVIELRRERALLESSSKPYTEIRPMVEEVDLRQKTILESVSALINDEINEYQLKLETIGKTSDSTIKQRIDSATAKTSETAGKIAVNVKTAFNDKVAPAAGDIGKGIKKGFGVTTKTLGKAGKSMLNRFNSKESKEDE